MHRISALILFLAALTLSSSVAQADAAPSIAGRFHYVSSAAQEAERKASIDAGIESMFFAIRPIARYRLNNATRAVSWVSFGYEGAQIRTRGPDDLNLLAPVTGAQVNNTWRGEKTRLSQRVTANGLVQSFIADEGAGLNEWTLSPDGNTLTVKVTITSSRLPKPIVFHQSYKRD